MAELLYQGHGSYRIVSDEGVVIYVPMQDVELYGQEGILSQL